MLTVLIASFAVPFVLAIVLTRTLVARAPRWGLVDHPGAHKQHARATPLGGGVAVFLAVTATMGLVVATAWVACRFPRFAALLPAPAGQHAEGVLSLAPLLGLIVAAATCQMVLGLVDDLRQGGLSYQFRLGVEILLVVGLISQGVSVTVFTKSLWITGPITGLWVVGLTNALNFLDNTDALAGSVGLIASFFFAVVALLIGDLFVLGGFLVLAGALSGFLPFNVSPARIFLGDAGSNFLGFWLGILTVVATFHTPAFGHVTVLAPLCILAVPIYDSLTVITIRLARRRSPFEPDRNHFSHRLMGLGFRPTGAVLVIDVLTVATGMSGVLLYFVSARAAALVVGQVACVLALIALLEFGVRRARQQ